MNSSLSPSKENTIAPTTQPTAIKAAHAVYSYVVLQAVSSSITASEFVSDSYAITSFETVVASVFGSMNPSVITIYGASDVTINSRKLISDDKARRLGSTSGILVNYTLGFDIYNDNSVSQTTTSLTNNITNWFTYTVDNGIFTSYLLASPCSDVNTMTSAIVPEVSQTPSISYLPSSSTGSNSNSKTASKLKSSYVAAIVVVVVSVCISIVEFCYYSKLVNSLSLNDKAIGDKENSNIVIESSTNVLNEIELTTLPSNSISNEIDFSDVYNDATTQLDTRNKLNDQSTFTNNPAISNQF